MHKGTTGEHEPISRRRWSRGWTGTILVIAAAGAGSFLLLRQGPPPAAAPAPPTVTVSAPLQRTVNEWERYIGRFAPSRVVDVRPRVSGQIVGIHFTDGAKVERDQVLFTLDKRPFEANLAEAKAVLEGARSDLELARAEAERGGRLSEVVVTKSELDKRRARVQSTVAAVEAAQARVQARTLDLEFTEVRAPIAGRVSDRRVDAGNLVSAGEGANATLLTTISAVDPIYFVFDASEGLFLKSKRAEHGGLPSARVEVRLQDEADYRWNGTLDFVDSGLNIRSGTIRLRAVMENSDQFLVPGMFGNMRLSSGGATSALLVPDAAIVTEQSRKLVLTVSKDGSVVPKPVEPGALIDGLRVVKSGLAPEDQVVITGVQIAGRTAKVQTKPGQIEPIAIPPSALPTQAGGEVTFAR